MEKNGEKEIFTIPPDSSLLKEARTTDLVSRMQAAERGRKEELSANV
jgi:hypothetical protein